MHRAKSDAMHVHNAIQSVETALRERRISVARLCRDAGIAQTTWVRWKSGKFSPSAPAWAKIEAALAPLVAESAEESAARPQAAA